MIYPYYCADCEHAFDISKPIAQYKDPAYCPLCDTTITEQNYAAKELKGFVSTEGDWTGGKVIHQLHPKHPDNMVTNKRQMEQVYKKHGISMDTGHFVSEEAQIKATVPIKHRSGNIPQAVGGVKEEN